MHHEVICSALSPGVGGVGGIVKWGSLQYFYYLVTRKVGLYDSARELFVFIRCIRNLGYFVRLKSAIRTYMGYCGISFHLFYLNMG